MTADTTLMEVDEEGDGYSTSKSSAAISKYHNWSNTILSLTLLCTIETTYTEFWEYYFYLPQSLTSKKSGQKKQLVLSTP